MTEMGDSIPDAAREQMLAQIPMKRFGDPDEIASVILVPVQRPVIVRHRPDAACEWWLVGITSSPSHVNP